jgi:hypothetical protein
MEEIAGDYFMELISRSMILPSQGSIHSTKGIDSCQVHDMMREIGISKSIEENLVFTLEEGCSSNNQGTVRHLAINGNWKGDQSEFESIVDMSRVRSVTVFGMCKSFFISGKMSLLRVLDLEDTTNLYDHHLRHIGRFLHLRYLSLRGCDDINHLPDSLGNLRELLTLDVRGTDIAKLPKTIINLQKLCNLRAGQKSSNENISYNGHREEGVMGYMACLVLQHLILSAIPAMAMRLECYGVLVPRGIRKLKAMHTLGVVNIGQQGKAILHDIKRLTQLRKLSVTGVNEKNGQELCSAIVCLSHLESLLIRSEGKPGLSGCLDGNFLFPKSLQWLKLYGNLVKLPEWIQGLKNLVKLKLRSCRITDHNDAMQVLGNLPSLASLHLLMESFKGVHLSFRPETFQSLVVLELAFESGVDSVKFEERATPKLELLSIFLRRVNSSTLSGLPTLCGLKELVLMGRAFIADFPIALDYVRAELALHPNRPVVRTVDSLW